MGLNGFPSSLWQVRRQAGRQTGALTLPKKGSSSAKPEELGQEQARTVSPPSHPPPPPPGILAVLGLAQLHRPQASAGTRNCLVLPPGPRGGGNGLEPPKFRVYHPEGPCLAPSPPALEAEQGCCGGGAVSGGSWRRARGPAGS